MFGHASQPSRIWSFGANAPVEGLASVEEQMRLAHRYRNALVEVELERRRRVDEALRRLSPELHACEDAIKAQETRLDEARGAIDRASQAARTKVRPPEAVAAVKQARADLKILRAQRKDLRTSLFASASWVAEQEAINGWASEEQKRRRAASGLYWGTYLHVEQSMAGCRSGAPPKFMRWTGNGHLAIQCQGGLGAADAYGSDNRVRLQVVGTKASGRKQILRVWFRVGSKDDGSPIWAQIPTILHRPLPADARIKWAHLIRRRIGVTCEWRVQFVLSRESGWAKPDCAATGTVGVDVGWRLLEDGSLRVSYWMGSDGQEGEMALPADWLGEMRRVERIRSYRDKLLNEMQEALVGRLKAITLPASLAERAQNVAQWRSAPRFAALALSWREARFDGDAEVYELLEAWRKRDRHLLEFEANLRDQLQRRREDLYRNFAAFLRRKYRTACVEDLDLREFHELPKAEEDSIDGALKEHVRDACLSLLRRCLKESMAEWIVRDAAYTTITCDCGHVGEPTASLWRTCGGCGRREDQDRQAARNLLGSAASNEVPTEA